MVRPGLSFFRPTKRDLAVVLVVTVLLVPLLKADFPRRSGPSWTGLRGFEVEFGRSTRHSSIYQTCLASEVPTGQAEVFAFYSGAVVFPTRDTTDGQGGWTIAQCEALCVTDAWCTGFAFYNPDGTCYIGNAGGVYPASDFSGFLKGTCDENDKLAGVSSLSSTCCNHYFANA